ncbi:MAG: mechanosensitive ion channel domain-containing protein [Myxococcota bacterium]
MSRWMRAIVVAATLASLVLGAGAGAKSPFDFVGPPAPEATAPEAGPAPGQLLESLGEEIRDALSFEHLLGVAIRLMALFVALYAFERLVRALVRWRLAAGRQLHGWLPTARLVAGTLALLVVVTAFTPDHPGARALVVAGVVLAILWSARESLRNAAASAVIIARQAIREGQHVRVGPHAGRVTSISLRGVELETAEGSRVFLPGVALHNEATVYAPGAGRAEPMTITWTVPPAVRADRLEGLRALARNLALLSPRRAPGTPVQVRLDEDHGRLVVEMTPFDPREADALREEVAWRLREALLTAENGQER